jgi:glycosyltransferase involved in cell wall biosynthesis
MTAGSSRPKVTVYIACHDYGRFLSEALESVAAQTFPDWELVVVDDASADETRAIAEAFAGRFPDRVRVLRHEQPIGLRSCANAALEAAHGDYIVRLDADDFLDENALLVLAHFLDEHPDIGLVFPNYTYVDEHGTILGTEYRKKIGTEAKLLDLPVHGACTMVRKRVLKSIGGYDERFDAQDGHELWLKVLHRYGAGNVSTPLFYYRQHGSSISSDSGRLLAARQGIKRGLALKQGGGVAPRIVAVVPAKNTYREIPDIVLREFVGRPLIDYTLESARNAGVFDKIIVTTDDPRVGEYCDRSPDIRSIVRPVNLSLPQVRLSQVLHDAVTRLEHEQAVSMDIVVLLNVHCPLRRAEHIREAVDTLLLHNADNVISVYEDYDLHFAHGAHGLEPLNKGMLQRLRLEREALFVDNGAINVMWRDVVTEENLYGRNIGHIVMPVEESLQMKDAFNAWVVEQVILRERAGARL